MNVLKTGKKIRLPDSSKNVTLSAAFLMGYEVQVDVAVLTMNAGISGSSCYNHPATQCYQVSTEKQFPYWV